MDEKGHKMIEYGKPPGKLDRPWKRRGKGIAVLEKAPTMPKTQDPP